MDADGGNRKRLTDSAGTDAHPSVSADGRYVVFESDRGDGSSIWRVDIDGGTPFRLTGGNGAGYPYCSPDGRWVYYYAHLDRYAPGLAEGQTIARGQPIASVGSTGDASPDGPHLHFEVKAMAPGETWHQGRAINPFPLLAAPLEREPPR